MPDTAYTRTFRRAIETLGTPERLARVSSGALGPVLHGLLQRGMRGMAPSPGAKHFRFGR